MKQVRRVNDAVGDKILVLIMSQAQLDQYDAAPAKFMEWMERTGRLPLPEPEPAPNTIASVTRRLAKKGK